MLRNCKPGAFARVDQTWAQRPKLLRGNVYTWAYLNPLLPRDVHLVLPTRGQLRRDVPGRGLFLRLLLMRQKVRQDSVSHFSRQVV